MQSYLRLFIPGFLYLFVITAKGQPVKVRYVAVADSKIYVEEYGRGKAVLLLHAGNMDHRMWKNQVTVLKKSFRVISMDIRGCGKTVDGDSTYLEAEGIKTVLDLLQIKEVTIIGSSLGAVAAVDFALLHPEMVGKLVLTSPGLIGINLNHDPKLVAYTQEMTNAYEKKDLTLYTKAFIKAWVDGPARKPQQVKAAVRKQAFEMAYQNITARKEGVHPGFILQPTQLEKLPSLKPKILVIMGELDMKDIYLCAQEYQKIGARLIIIKGAAHLVNLEKPEAYNQAVSRFLLY